MEPYPVDLLPQVKSVALVFGSGFGGKNDGSHVRDAGIENVTVVDADPVSLDAMAHDFKTPWAYVCSDAFAFARFAASKSIRWDLVSADLPSSMPLQMVDELPLWCAIASKYVVSTVMRHNFPWSTQLFELPEPPEGWRYRRLLRRSQYRGGVWWLVTEKL